MFEEARHKEYSLIFLGSAVMEKEVSLQRKKVNVYHLHPQIKAFFKAQSLAVVIGKDFNTWSVPTYHTWLIMIVPGLYKDK